MNKNRKKTKVPIEYIVESFFKNVLELNDELISGENKNDKEPLNLDNIDYERLINKGMEQYKELINLFKKDNYETNEMISQKPIKEDYTSKNMARNKADNLISFNNKIKRDSYNNYNYLEENYNVKSSLGIRKKDEYNQNYKYKDNYNIKSKRNKTNDKYNKRPVNNDSNYRYPRNDIYERNEKNVNYDIYDINDKYPKNDIYDRKEKTVRDSNYDNNDNYEENNTFNYEYKFDEKEKNNDYSNNNVFIEKDNYLGNNYYKSEFGNNTVTLGTNNDIEKRRFKNNFGNIFKDNDYKYNNNNNDIYDDEDANNQEKNTYYNPKFNNDFENDEKEDKYDNNNDNYDGYSSNKDKNDKEENNLSDEDFGFSKYNPNANTSEMPKVNTKFPSRKRFSEILNKKQGFINFQNSDEPISKRKYKYFNNVRTSRKMPHQKGQNRWLKPRTSIDSSII